MPTATYPSFDDKAISQAIETAQRHSKALQAKAGGQQIGADNGELMVSAQCISLTVNNGQVCLNLPLGLGSVCLPVPPWVPSGATVSACLDICSVFGAPCGVKVTVSFNNIPIVQKGYGCC
ncbi:MAG TPA: hypothetical protein VF759_13495 [Allosphingosinicella sp.]|jgi:hypothetical protein